MYNDGLLFGYLYASPEVFDFIIVLASSLLSIVCGEYSMKPEGK